MALPDFAQLSDYQKWRRLLVLLVGFLASSVAHVVVAHFGFQNTKTLSISLIAVVLSLSIFVFIYLHLKTKAGKPWSIAINPSTQNSEWIAFFLLGVCLLFGPKVTLYLVVCYLAFAPLFLDNQNTLRLDNLFVATSFGILVSGLIYVLSADVGMAGEITVPVLFLSLATANTIYRRKQIIPDIAPPRLSHLGILSILFFAFCGTVLVGSFLMGLGDYPRVFFNVDTPLRLTHAHEILGLTEYPPEALTTSGVYRSYHYGGPSSASAITAITGIALHKSMFWVVIPLLLIGSFSAFHLIARSILKLAMYRCLAMILFLPFVRLGEHLYYWFIYNAQAHGAFGMLLIIVKGFIPFSNYGPEEFGGGVWDISKTAGILLLLISSFLLVKKQTLHVTVLAPAIVLLTFFVKIALVPAVSVLVGVRLLKSWKEHSLAKTFFYLIGCSAISILVLYLFGTFEAVGNSATVRNFFQVIELYSGNKSTKWVLIELTFVIGFSILFLSLRQFSFGMYHDKGALLLVFGILASMSICFLVVSFFEVKKVWGAPYKVSWIAIPLLSSAILATAENSRYSKVIVGAVIAPVLLIAFMGQWQKIQQLAVTSIYPELGHEFADNRDLGEALAAIPRYRCGLERHDKCYGDYVRSYPDLQVAYTTSASEQSIEEWGEHHWTNYGKLEKRVLKGNPVIVTNDFQYLWVKHHQTPISALMGHQAFAVDAYWLQHDSALIQVANHRVRLQKENLSPLFNKSRPDFSKEVKSIAKQLGWTHFLFSKKDMGRVLRSRSIVRADSRNTGASDSDPADSNNRVTEWQNPPPVVLRRVLDAQQDRVSCGRGGLKPDGIMDNVFVAYLDIPPDQVPMQPKITMIDIFRDHPPGRSYTNDHSLVLGVSHSLEGDLINRSKGSVSIPINQSRNQFWLFSCNHRHDKPNSRYFAQLTFSLPLKISEYDSASDIPLKMLFENKTFAVYEF